MKIDNILYRLFCYTQNALNNLLIQNGFTPQELSSQLLDESVFCSIMIYL